MANIMTGRDPFAMDTIKLHAQRYVMSHRGCGERHANAYIAGAMEMLKVINQQMTLTL